MHPAHELRGIKSNKLSGKTIVLGVTGSIAAVESVKLSHELIRHGATVIPVLTKAGCDIISPDALGYATGVKPITRLTGETEHVALCGEVDHRADLLLIAPCTANTISKIACGIDDSTVTTFATTAIGSNIPIIIVPAMHSSMYNHPIISENVDKLQNKKLNIDFVQPRMSENKWKLASVDEIVSKVICKLWHKDLVGKRVLVIGGATAESIDEMRILTNRSTGRTGSALAVQAYLRGADVVLWQGYSATKPPEYISFERFENVSDLEKKVKKLIPNGKKMFHIIIVCAAISDYTPTKQIHGKVPSGKDKLKIELVPTKKIIKIIRNKTKKGFIVGYKAEANQSESKILEQAYKRLKEWGLNLIIANDLSKVKVNSNQILIIDTNKKYKKIKDTKEVLSERIFDEIVKLNRN
jgi:phosphopantothenoylcysteine decarboxylase/phosphopantothenate--cysteine ligase